MGNINFKQPNKEYLPRLRFWWPGGYVANHLDELDLEFKSIAEAGFGGVEIANVYDGLSEEACLELQPNQYGFTSENWKKSVIQALKSAKNYNLSVDLTVGPHWPATTNEATPNDEGTAKELVYGTKVLEDSLSKGTNLETICPPHYQTNHLLPSGEEIVNSLVGLYVAKQIEHSEIEVPPAVPWEKATIAISDKIEFNSLKDITFLVEGNYLIEDIDLKEKNMILIAIYQRGTGQRVNMFTMVSPTRPDVMSPNAFVVDHFSKKGAEFIIQLWEKNFLVDQEFKSLLEEVGDCFFEDSLELQSVGHWTDNMLSEFKRLKKYDLKPFLPFVIGINQDKSLEVDTASFQVEDKFKHKIKELRHDYFETLNKLYQEYHLKSLKNWSNTLKMKFRAQPYGWAIDSAEAATFLDVVEGESLGFGEDGNDAFRMLAAGRDFGGLNILSDEAGAYLFQGYATTLPQLFETLHKNYMAGVNQTYWHGYPFKYAPQVKWPGFSAFNPMLGGRGFAEAWGDRQPVWEYLKPYTTYLGRVHQLLRYGKNSTDILIYQNGHNATENKIIEIGNDLTQLGYTYQIMTEGLFNTEVLVKNNKFYAEGNSYKILLIPSKVEISEKNRLELIKWQTQGIKIYYLKDDLNYDELEVILGKSVFKNQDTSLLTYNKVGDKEFTFCYNQGEELINLDKFLGNDSCIEWLPWSGDVRHITDNSLKPKEFRIFEKLKENKSINNPKKEIEKKSLTNQEWNLVIDKWEMENEDSVLTNKIKVSKKISTLVYWNAIEEFKNTSGVGCYETNFTGDKAPISIHVPNVQGSLSVKLNNEELVGNPITGYFEVNKNILLDINRLQIFVGSTLNNYLNNCSLTEYYGKYDKQNYGIEEAYLVYEK